MSRHVPALDTIPEALHALRAWLVWRWEPNAAGKPLKVPYYVDGAKRSGVQGSPADVARLVDLPAALRAAQRPDVAGVGLALREDLGVVALDLDNLPDVSSPPEDVAALLAATYAEVSPSGKGLRVLLRGAAPDLRNRKAPGVEVFQSRGFVTVTGDVHPLSPAAWGAGCELGDVHATGAAAWAGARLGAAGAGAGAGAVLEGAQSQAAGLSFQDIRQALLALPAALPYADWVQVGMALHAETQGAQAGLELWQRWSATSVEEGHGDLDQMAAKWAGFGRQAGDAVTGRTLLHLARQYGGPDTGAASLDEFQRLDEAADAAPSRFRPLTEDEFTQQPGAPWLVKGLLPAQGGGILYGAPGTGKSFLALDIASHVARGVAWRGRKVRQGRAVYLAAEGQGGFRRRMQAYRQHHAVPTGVEVIPVPVALPDKAQALELARAIGRAALIVIDTLAMVTPGADENSAQDMGPALLHAQGIAKATGACVLLVHHAGKDATRGARGWSGIAGWADAIVEVSRPERDAAGGAPGLSGAAEVRQAVLTKAKEGEDGLVFNFALEVVSLGFDEDDEEVTSCVAVEASPPPQVTLGSTKRKLGPVEAAVLQAVQAIAEAQTAGIEVAGVVEHALAALGGETEEGAARKQARNAIKRAIKRVAGWPDAPFTIEEGGTLCVA